MGGVHFNFENFSQLILLNIGIAERIDENRAESFTLLYCDFSDMTSYDVAKSLEEILRNSDSVVNFEKDYFFILPYTDKYGAKYVKEMFDEFFGKSLTSVMVSYPVDGEKVEELFNSVEAKIEKTERETLDCLSKITKKS